MYTLTPWSWSVRQRHRCCTILFIFFVTISFLIWFAATHIWHMVKLSETNGHLCHFWFWMMLMMMYLVYQLADLWSRKAKEEKSSRQNVCCTANEHKKLTWHSNLRMRHIRLVRIFFFFRWMHFKIEPFSLFYIFILWMFDPVGYVTVLYCACVCRLSKIRKRLSRFAYLGYLCINCPLYKYSFSPQNRFFFLFQFWFFERNTNHLLFSKLWPYLSVLGARVFLRKSKAKHTLNTRMNFHFHVLIRKTNDRWRFRFYDIIYNECHCLSIKDSKIACDVMICVNSFSAFNKRIFFVYELTSARIYHIYVYVSATTRTNNNN